MAHYVYKFKNANLNMSVPFSLENLIMLDHSINKFSFYNHNTTSITKYIVDNPGFYFLNSKKELKMWFELLRNIYVSMSYIYDKLSSWYKEERSIKKKYVCSHMPFTRSKLVPYPERPEEHFVEGPRLRSELTLIEKRERNREQFHDFTVSDLCTVGILSQAYYHPFAAIEAYVDRSKYAWPCLNMPKSYEERLCYIEGLFYINNSVHLVLCRYHMYVISKYMEIIKYWLRASAKGSNVEIIKLKEQPKKVAV